jgi:Tetratricopeptide repeat
VPTRRWLIGRGERNPPAGLPPAPLSTRPTVGRRCRGLVGILRDQGDLAGAHRLVERALVIREARLGADHPATAWSRRNLAAVVAELQDRQ